MRNVHQYGVVDLTGNVFVIQFVESLQDILFNDPEVLGVDGEAHVTVVERGDGLLKIRQEIWSKALYPTIFQENAIGNIIEDPRSKPNLRVRDEWIGLFILVLVLELNIINDYEALLDDKAEEV